MRKNPVDPDRSGRSDRTARRQWGGGRGFQLHGRLTPVQLLVGGLALALLSISVVGSVIATTRSYASTNQSIGVLDACTTATATSVPTNAPAGGGTTSTPRPRKTVTGTPASSPTATAAPVTPTAVATTPVATPTTATTPVSSASPSSTVNTSAVSLLSSKVSCSPTTTATIGTQTPTVGTTPIDATTPVSSTGGSSLPPNPAGSGGGFSSTIIIGSVLMVLVLGLLAGWFYFRRILLPQGIASSNLPPSGARPWSRTRAPNPDSLGGLAAVQGGSAGPGGPAASGMATSNMFAGSPPAMPANHGYNGPAHANFGQPTMNGNGNGAGSGNFGQPAMNGNGNGVGPGNFGQPTMNGYGNGPGYFSDGFIPPSPQIFPQSDQSMIPPGSGAFPVIANANGFTPASQAFNAMYGLPDDPFSSSQAGSPGWMSNLGNMSLANGQSGPGGSSPNPNKGNLAPGEIDINDPQIDEIIRQYSQKGQNTPQPQQHMPPAQPPQQQRMLPTRPPESVVPVVAALPLSPTPPAPPTPQREQGPNSRWLQ